MSIHCNKIRIVCSKHVIYSHELMMLKLLLISVEKQFSFTENSIRNSSKQHLCKIYAKYAGNFSHFPTIFIFT